MVTVGKLLRSSLFSFFSPLGAAGALPFAGLTMIPTPDPPSPVPSCTSGPVFRAPVAQRLAESRGVGCRKELTCSEGEGSIEPGQISLLCF